MGNEFLREFLNEPIYIIKEDSIQLSETLPDSSSASTVEISYKGQNKKGILILVSNPGDEYLSPDKEELLKKILQSVNLSFIDIALINISSHPHSDFLNLGNIIISFGIEHVEEISAIPHFYQSHPVNEKIIIRCHSLEQIADDRELKLKLWNCLKNQFIKE
ncbi:MAG: hypothetical protein OEY34_09745 [Cyclobacteriaceae bacterium]|nr:hypothetical protein [Cyclobacteriaceae bacterium]